MADLWAGSLGNQKTPLLHDAGQKWSDADDMSVHTTLDGQKAATDYNTFDKSPLERFYVPVDTYEGRHRYDPKAQWTAEEEKTLVRRVG